MLTASVKRSLAGARDGRAVTARVATASMATSERTFGMMFPPYVRMSEMAARMPVRRRGRRSDLGYVFRLPGGRTGLCLALSLAGGEHGPEVVVDRRGPSRCGVLGVLSAHIGAGQAFAHPCLGGELAIRLQHGVERATVDARLHTLQASVEVDDLLIRHKIGHCLGFLGWQILDLSLQRGQLALKASHPLFLHFHII